MSDAITENGRYVVISPRQRGMLALILGALIAWGSLYWASALGWAPAMEANAYTLSPLLAVGLIASDMGRSNSDALRTAIGTAVAALGIAAGIWLTASLGFTAGVVYLIAVAALGTAGEHFAKCVQPCIRVDLSFGHENHSLASP